MSHCDLLSLDCSHVSTTSRAYIIPWPNPVIPSRYIGQTRSYPEGIGQTDERNTPWVWPSLTDYVLAPFCFQKYHHFFISNRIATSSKQGEHPACHHVDVHRWKISRCAHETFYKAHETTGQGQQVLGNQILPWWKKKTCEVVACTYIVMENGEYRLAFKRPSTHYVDDNVLSTVQSIAS